MIYLLKDCYQDDNNQYHNILKIGYSDKLFVESRKSAYDTHNYGYKFLREIEGPTQLESFLHKLFDSLRLDREWFNYSDKIIDFFDNYKNEDLGLFLNSTVDIKDNLRSNIDISRINNDKQKIIDKIINEIKISHKKEFEDIYYDEKYPFERVLRKEINNTLDFITKRIKIDISTSILDNYNYTSYNDLKQKLISFKNNINLIFKTQKNLQSREDFDRIQEERRRQTKILLDSYNILNSEQQKSYVKKLKTDIEVNEYVDDFVAISKNTNKPVYNTLIDIANERAWEVSQEDYQCCINVTQAIKEVGTDIGRMYTQSSYYDYNDQVLNEFLQDFFGTPRFPDRMKKYCEFCDKNKDDINIMESLDYKLKDKTYNYYYSYYGIKGCKARKYQKSLLDHGFSVVTREDLVKERIYSLFKEGDRISKSDLKIRLQELYDVENVKKRAKASDLGRYFELSTTRITLSGGKVVSGFKLGKKL